MKTKFRFAQWINIIATANFISLVVIENEISYSTIRFAMVFSGTLFVGSLLSIILLSISFLRKLDTEGERCSSNLSPIFKYLMTNPAISAILVLMVFGIIYNIDLVKVALLFFLVILYPMIMFAKSMFVVLSGSQIKFYDYNFNIEAINKGQVHSVKKVQLGLIYSIKYLNQDGLLRTRYFFPTGSFLMFNEPDCIKRLKLVSP